MTPTRESDTERLARIVGDEQAIMACVGELSMRLADAEAEIEALRRRIRMAVKTDSERLRQVLIATTAVAVFAAGVVGGIDHGLHRHFFGTPASVAIGWGAGMLTALWAWTR